MKRQIGVLTLLAMMGAKLVLGGAVPGQDAPAFQAVDIEGKGLALSDFKGKYVVLEWYNPGCPFVRKWYQNGDMQKLQRELTSQGVVWITINSSAPGKQGHLTPPQWKELVVKNNSAATHYVADEKGDIGRAYGAQTTPHMFVIGPDGKLLYAGAIDSKPSTDPGDIVGATNYVRRALEEAKAGKPVSVPQTKPYGCSVKY